MRMFEVASKIAALFVYNSHECFHLARRLAAQDAGAQFIGVVEHETPAVVQGCACFCAASNDLAILYAVWKSSLGCTCSNS